ncbi:hypothetical protein Lser_V15G02636 [Lactuca serriola]
MKNLKASKFQFLCKPNQHGSKLTQIRKRKRNNYQYQQTKSGVLERCNQRCFSWKAAIKDVGGGNLNGYCQSDVLLEGFEIQNRETHHNLRHDLTEYIWERQFQGQNDGEDDDDDDGDDEEEDDGGDEADDTGDDNDDD